MLFLLLFWVTLFQPTTRAAHCMGNQYSVGKWVMNASKEMEKSLVCCEHDATINYYNQTYCGPSNSVMMSNRGSNTQFSYPGGHACHCDKDEGGLMTTVHNRERYYWMPLHCTLPTWNAKDFCRLLGTRRILTVGDSTFRQSSMTLASMIYAGQGGCADQIYFNASEDLINKKILHSLFDVLNESPCVPDIVLTGSGAHVKSLEQYATNWNRLQKVFLAFHKRNPEMKFIWKTQNPGHVQCWTYKTPVENWNKTKAKDEYSWYLHDDFDAMSISNIKNLTNLHLSHSHDEQQGKTEEIPFIQVMDMSPLKLRPDSHARSIHDCLHYCMPGALNLFSVLMYNLLLTGQL
jgi:hypothetical protein